MRYLALLRGINVGGKAKVEMARLKVAIEGLGFDGVRTYINSGNVVFSAPRRSTTTLATEIEDRLETEFGWRIRVLVLSRADLAAVVDAMDDNWVNNRSDTKCDVMFLWPDHAKPAVVQKFDINASHEELRYVRGALMWRCDQSYRTRSKLPKQLFGSDLYRNMTGRNCNTTRKLLDLLDEG